MIVPRLDLRSQLGNLSQAGRLLLGLALFGAIISRISWADLMGVLRTLETHYLFGAYALFLLTVVLLTYRWYFLHGIYRQGRPTFRRLLAANFMGIFFNNVMPSSVGGDVFRVVHMSRENAGFSGAFSTVFVDRVIGLLALVLVGLFSALVGRIYIDIPTELAFWSGGVFTFLCIVLVLSSSTRFHSVVLSLSSILLPESKREWVYGKLSRFSSHLAAYSGEKKLLMKALMTSIAFQVVWISGCYMISLALQLDLSIYIFFAIMPLIELIRAIPITIQGIGVREGAFVVFFSRFGISSTEAIVLALLIYLLLSLNGIIGGILFLLRSLTPSLSGQEGK
jgi:hypothetical protein